MSQVYEGIEEHLPPLRRYASSLTRDHADAEDLLQQCMVLALRNAHQFRPDSNLRAWLFTILRNQHYSNKRKASREGGQVDPDAAAKTLAAPPRQEIRLELEDVGRALDGLPKHQRKLIKAVALKDESYEVAARAADLTVGTVKSRVSRGREKMRKVLGWVDE